MKRQISFDIAKAIALIAVVIGHTSFVGIPASIVDLCYSFDMPLFFIISGYFCKDAVIDRVTLSKNIKGLLVPYLATACIVILVMTARDFLVGLPDWITTFFKWLIAGVYGAGSVMPGMPAGVIAIGAIWYLLALFWAKLLLISAEQTDHPGVVSLVLFVIGIYTKDAIWLPFAIQPALCATLFLFIGRYMKQKDLLSPGSIPLLLRICIVATWVYCAAFYGKLYMVTNTYAAGAIDVIGGVCGSICVIYFSRWLESCGTFVASGLSLMGRNTLPLFCMHLVELNAIDWSVLINRFGGVGVKAGVAGLAVHTFSIAILTLLLYLSPRFLSGVFFRSRKQVRAAIQC